jgi:hypothetical protein
MFKLVKTRKTGFELTGPTSARTLPVKRGGGNFRLKFSCDLLKVFIGGKN